MDIELIKIILAFVVLINPFSALGLFLNITNGYTPKDRKKVAQIACLTIFATVAFFAFMGDHLLKFLGISVGSFQIAGGILVFLIAISMMNGGGNPVKPDGDSISVHSPLAAMAVVPLAIPMMIGPGGISTVIIYAGQMPSVSQKLSIVGAGFLISVFCYISLLTSSKISRFLGDTGLSIMSRVMGMLLAAVAVEIVISGIKAVLPVIYAATSL
ncbi:MarC family protein [Moraxella haemolytica]|uniref:MarC family protein n=1 Tax=Moraxella TaxID=475 RepID=UPI002542791D|nr:MarC family protein [Moraxella sp. ZY171148]WII94537.1 MarC family protein [Moraxella sp. ZY171148]